MRRKSRKCLEAKKLGLLDRILGLADNSTSTRSMVGWKELGHCGYLYTENRGRKQIFNK